MELQIIDIEEITPLEINRKLKSIEADLEYYIDKKQRIYNATQPKSVNYDRMSIQGGCRENIFEKYAILNEELDPIIDFLQDEKKALTILLERKLKASGEYSKILETLIGLKERHYSWARIDKEYVATKKIPASIGTCRNIWRRHIGKRTI